MQGHMQALQQQLAAVSTTVEAASEAGLGAAIAGLQQVKGLHSAYAAAAAQVSSHRPHGMQRHLHAWTTIEQPAALGMSANLPCSWQGADAAVYLSLPAAPYCQTHAIFCSGHCTYMFPSLRQHAKGPSCHCLQHLLVKRKVSHIGGFVNKIIDMVPD